ncbi:MAG: dihydrolipoyl dehydrogenase [Eubacteriaceae bacterium]|nr:dihydrolipoyl dehydrogenase [Eubacteriaceae bacterium]
MKITIIGAGPGGYEAAIYAAKKGAEVVLIEKDSFGGTCLNRGCIPTKAFLASSSVLEMAHEAKSYGIKIDGTIEPEYSKIVDRKNKVVAGLVKGIGALLTANNVTQIKGFGKIVDKNTIEVTKDDGTIETVTTDYIVLGMGSVPTTPGMFKYDGNRVITSDEILDMKEAPQSVILVGGGVIGTEIGQFLAAMGTKVTIVEMMDRLLPTMDEDVSKQLARQFKKDKINVITSNGIAEVLPSSGSVEVVLQSGDKLSADYLLVAIGRMPFTKDCGLENVGIEFTEWGGRVKVNEYLQTNVDNIYAIGDLIDTAMLAHVATYEGICAIDNIMGKQWSPKYHAVPGCVYTTPAIASVGATELELQKEGKTYNTGTFDFRGLGKAQASGHIAGFVKVIADENDVLIGASIVGDTATDMLQVLTLAVQLGLTSEQMLQSIFPHPTMCEAILEALHDLHGLSIHKL